MIQSIYIYYFTNISLIYIVHSQCVQPVTFSVMTWTGYVKIAIDIKASYNIACTFLCLRHCNFFHLMQTLNC